MSSLARPPRSAFTLSAHNGCARVPGGGSMPQCIGASHPPRRRHPAPWLQQFRSGPRPATVTRHRAPRAQPQQVVALRARLRRGAQGTTTRWSPVAGPDSHGQGPQTMVALRRGGSAQRIILDGATSKGTW